MGGGRGRQRVRAPLSPPTLFSAKAPLTWSMRAALHVYGVYRAQEKYWGDKNQGEKRNENKNSLSEHNMYTYTWLQSMQFFH